MNLLRQRVFLWGATAVVLLAASSFAAAQGAQSFEFKPDDSSIHFSLDASMHTVHGEFRLKHGTVHFDPATGAISGEIVIDAASGKSGNDGRDHKMHRDVLESERYPEIVFRPDRVEGKLAPQGSSTLQVHGMFGVHGSEHEITMPVQIEMTAGHWSATTHFEIPFVKWGMKNPSNFLIHVKENVEIEAKSAGARP